MCDSSASDHFTYNIDDFSEYEPFQEGQMHWVKTADSIPPLKGQGTVIIKHQLKNGKSHLVKLHPVLYMPSATAHLISNGRLCKQGLVAVQNDKWIVFSFKTIRKHILKALVFIMKIR